MLPDLTPVQWLLGCLAALLVGAGKTGLPGIGVLVVPIMAMTFGGKTSVGMLLPMLIVGDIFAVWWYRRHAQWDKLWKLFPWVLPGLLVGCLILAFISDISIAGLDGNDLFRPVIGCVVLAMLFLQALRMRDRDRLVPHGPLAVAATGVGTGAATALANAAGPIMTLYLLGMRMPKEQFMGTNAWFFLILNLVKVPLYVIVTFWDPSDPMFSVQTVSFDILMVPLILIGAFTGKWILPRIPQIVFNWSVLVLAGIAALRLVVSLWI